MPERRRLSRRGFLCLSGAAAAGAVLAGPKAVETLSRRSAYQEAAEFMTKGPPDWRESPYAEQIGQLQAASVRLIVAQASRKEEGKFDWARVGSGFLFQDKQGQSFLVSALKVVAQSARWPVIPPAERLLLGFAQPDEGKWHKLSPARQYFEPVLYQQGVDIALFPLKTEFPLCFQPLSLADKESVRKTQQVIYGGYPPNVSRPNWREQWPDQFWFFSGDIWNGFNGYLSNYLQVPRAWGGAVINEQGEVVGVHTGYTLLKGNAEITPVIRIAELAERYHSG